MQRASALVLTLPLLSAAPPTETNALHAEGAATLEDIQARYALEGGTWDMEASEQRNIFGLVKPSDVVLDIGANIGRSTIVAAVCAGPTGRVVASEADPKRRMGPLRQNVEGLNNVEVISAISDTQLTLTVGDLGSTTGAGHAAGAEGNGSYIVATTPLASVRGLKPDVLLVDCEGCFDELISALGPSTFLENTRAIEIEHDSTDVKAQQATHDMLLDLGFKVTSCIGQSFSPDVSPGDFLFHDCYWAVLER